MAINKEVHLLCSSGGVRCFSYIGAYRALLEAGYKVSGVSASSMGSVIGMLICCGLSPDELEDKVFRFPIKKYIKKRFWIKTFGLTRYPFAMNHHPDYSKMLTDFFGKDPIIDELPISYSTLALDLRMQELLSINKETHSGMKASMLLKIATAIPPLFAPVELDNRLLVDAGIATESPAWVASAESEGKPVVVLKTKAGLNDVTSQKFGNFIGKMIQSAAVGNDEFYLELMPNSISVEINCGDQKAEDFEIKPERIRTMILEGQRVMEKKLELCQGDLKKFIKVENISKQAWATNSNDRARERNINLLRKFQRQTEGRHQVFISYSHLDMEWFHKLQLVLAPVEAFHGIKVWDDKEIATGEFWHESIKNALSKTKLAICLISPNFLNSNFITNHELQYFLSEAKNQQVRIFPIMVTRANLENNPLTNIQFAHNPKIPLDEMTEPQQHEVLDNMVKSMVETFNAS